MRNDSVTDAQARMLLAIDRYGGVDHGWAEVELSFLSTVSDALPVYLEAVTCWRVGNALRRKGLITEDSGPVLTDFGRETVAMLKDHHELARSARKGEAQEFVYSALGNIAEGAGR